MHIANALLISGDFPPILNKYTADQSVSHSSHLEIYSPLPSHLYPFHNGTDEFLIKWKGDSEDTWLPAT